MDSQICQKELQPTQCSNKYNIFNHSHITLSQMDSSNEASLKVPLQKVTSRSIPFMMSFMSSNQTPQAYKCHHLVRNCTTGWMRGFVRLPLPSETSSFRRYRHKRNTTIEGAEPGPYIPVNMSTSSVQEDLETITSLALSYPQPPSPQLCS